MGVHHRLIYLKNIKKRYKVQVLKVLFYNLLMNSLKFNNGTPLPDLFELGEFKVKLNWVLGGVLATVHQPTDVLHYILRYFFY